MKKMKLILLSCKIARFMYLINEKKVQDIGIWSMRNIRKLFRRLQSQLIDSKSYIKITPEHQVVLFILQSIIPEKRIEVLEKILPIMENAFDLENIEKDNIINCIKSPPKVKKINEQLFLYKGKSAILIPKYIESIINDELQSLLESLFYILFCHPNEPLLLVGPSGFKTYLAKSILTNPPIINLYQETSISQLLGSISLTNSKKAKAFYLRKILEICHKTELEETFLEYLDYIEVTNKTEEEIEKELEIEKKKLEEERQKQEKLFEEFSKKLEEVKNEDNDNEDDLSSDNEDSKQKKVKGKRTIKRKITNKKKRIMNL